RPVEAREDDRLIEPLRAGLHSPLPLEPLLYVLRTQVLRPHVLADVVLELLQPLLAVPVALGSVDRLDVVEVQIGEIGERNVGVGGSLLLGLVQQEFELLVRGVRVATEPVELAVDRARELVETGGPVQLRDAACHGSTRGWSAWEW